MKSNDDDMKSLAVNGRSISSGHSSSFQQYSKLNQKGSLKDIREPNNNHLKKTKSDNQAFQRFFSSNSSTINSSTFPTSSSSSKGRKAMLSSNNHSTPILPQTKLSNTSNFNSSNNPYNSSSRQHPLFSNNTNNITSISHVTATPNFLKKSNTGSNSNHGNSLHHFISRSNGSLSAEPTRINYYKSNDMDIDGNYSENKRKSSFNGNIINENVFPI